jgi:hypothetical protein
MKNVGRINRGTCSQFPCDSFLDNIGHWHCFMSMIMSESALQVAALPIARFLQGELVENLRVCINLPRNRIV